jgi:hypothetical protein
MIEINITINGIERTYRGDYHTMHANDWSDIIRERLDEVVSDERGHLVDERA